MAEAFIREVLNPARLAALRRLGILDTPAEVAFDRLSELACKILRTPVSLVTLVDDTRQFFKSCRGLPEPWSSWRESPLSHSFCQHVLASNEPLVITDARAHPVFSTNLATHEWSVIAYLGIPLVLGDGLVLGSFCVIDHTPRIWTADEIEAVRVLARAATAEIELRSEINHRAELNRELVNTNQGLKAFTYSVAHDLRGHLHRLRWFADLLVEENRDAPAACLDYIAGIQRVERQITELLDGLLTLARANTMDINLQPVDVTAIAREVLAELRQTNPTREVEVVLPNNLSARADPALTRLLLQNLIGNAWKYTATREGARIEISASPCGETTRFTIRDNGVGFPAEQAAQLFQPFHRLENALEFPGNGLGLQGVKRIVDRHGGTIEATGEPNGGACFSFTLEPPVLKSPRTAAVFQEVAPEMPAPKALAGEP